MGEVLRIEVSDRVYLYGCTAGTLAELKSLFTYVDPRDGFSQIPTWRESSFSAERSAEKLLSFPRGGFRRVYDVIKARGLALEVKDLRESGDFSGTGFTSLPPHNVKLWALQERAVEALLARQNGLLRAPTGSGKTTIALAAIARANVPALVVVQSAGLRDQWIERVVKEMGIPRDRIGMIGDGIETIGPITIGMNQTIVRRMQENTPNAQLWKKTFGLVAFDEVQGAAAPTVQASIDPFPAKYRIGVSADPTRADAMEFLIYDLFGKPVADIKMHDVLMAGSVLDVEVRIIPTRFYAPWYRDMVSRGGMVAKLAFNKLLATMTSNEGRNQLIVDAITYEVQQEHAQAIVISHRREHAMRLDALLTQRGVKSGTMLGGKTGKDTFKATGDGIRNGVIDVAIGTIQAIGQGIDLPSVEAGFVVTPLANNRQKWQQARGRICRISKGKKRAVMYYLHDVTVYGKKAVENLVDWNSKVVAWVDGGWVSADRYIEWIARNR